jgi:hypothetical protein
LILSLAFLKPNRPHRIIPGVFSPSDAIRPTAKNIAAASVEIKTVLISPPNPKINPILAGRKQVEPWLSAKDPTPQSLCFFYFFCRVGEMRKEYSLTFSVNHPYVSMVEGRAFLDKLPVSEAARRRIACGNAERLRGL